ncbi:MAG TPA: DUF4124 domain-containing protein [Deltaproteobacteria bacterium]|nr:DUF4124 domain-containing protein [Deltaproteobacteria bacterium]
MKIFIIIFAFFSFSLSSNVSADFYTYVDENGVTVITNVPGNVPENQRATLKTHREQRDVLSHSHPVTRTGDTEEYLEEEEREITRLREKGASEEEIKYLKCFFKSKREENKVWTENEKKELDSLLRLIWTQMVSALRRGDVDTAVSYFSEHTREQYREIYSTFHQNKILPDVSRELELSIIAMVRVSGNNSATYEILCTREGKTYSFQLSFIRDCDDEWKIESY